MISLKQLEAQGTTIGERYAEGAANLFTPMTDFGEGMGVEDARQVYVDSALAAFDAAMDELGAEMRAHGATMRAVRALTQPAPEAEDGSLARTAGVARQSLRTKIYR